MTLDRYTDHAMAELVESGRGLAFELEDVPTARVAVDLTLGAVGAADDQGHDQQCGMIRVVRLTKLIGMREAQGGDPEHLAALRAYRDRYGVRVF